MELTARITADATLTTLKDERKVINFTVAHNEYYKAKGSTETKQITEFIQCAFWLNPKLAQYLTKGTLVEISGRMGVNAYTTHDGAARANLTCHVNAIKLHGGGKAKGETPTATTASALPSNSSAENDKTPADDLPF